MEAHTRRAPNVSPPIDIPSTPQRILKRASNILTSTGQPSVKGLDEILAQNERNGRMGAFDGEAGQLYASPFVDSPVSYSPTTPKVLSSPPGVTKLKLTASIKRKFQEVRESGAGVLGLSRSLSGSSGSGTTSGGRKNEGLTSTRIAEARVGHGTAKGISNRSVTNPKRNQPHTRSASFSSTTTVRPDVLQHSLSSPMALPSLPSVAESVGLHHDPREPHWSHAPLSSSAPAATSPIASAPPPPTADPLLSDITVPLLLQQGTPMTKVTANKRKKAVFRLDPNLGQIIWESKAKQRRIIPIETIKEIRSSSDARYYREQFQLAASYEDRWLTIVYILDGTYKTLHLIADTRDVFRMWNYVLRQMHAVRRELMSGGGGHWEVREAIWERRCWGGGTNGSAGAPSGMGEGESLSFAEVEKMCRRLNINSSPEELARLFKQADSQKRNVLDFEDFRRFVKLLKGRPDIERLFRKARERGGGAYSEPAAIGSDGKVFDFAVFRRFMREKQMSDLSDESLRTIFEKYSVPITLPSSEEESLESAPSTTSSAPRHMTIDTFSSFLLSPDNSVFTDHHAKVTHDMTRPLSDYYVSSSHNTYLVGHQLVGVSTVEGYIRALLHSCRSVELDIYDGDSEPMIFHGKTFTSKVSLREVCNAIMRYGFVASPYPIIISAEVHCSLSGQDMIADIMHSAFGDALVRVPMHDRQQIVQLPSPEDLKGKILFKTKNLYIGAGRKDSMDVDYPSAMSEISASNSTSASSTSDSDAIYDQQLSDGGMNGARRGSDAAKADLNFLKRGPSVLQRVRSVGKSSSARSPPSSAKSTPLTTPPSSPVKKGSLPPSASSASHIASLSSEPDSQLHYPQYQSLSGPNSSTHPANMDLSVLHTSPVPKPKMSQALLELLVYTVGVKCRGINKKEVYLPEHMFSLSETVANRMIKTAMPDLIKHCRTHLVRVYPKGMRVSSTNYEPHRYWSAGAQLVAINWQTFDLGYMINHAMFQRNGRAGYVLKPPALRGPPASKDLLAKHTHHHFNVHIISAQQLPRPKDSSGREIIGGGPVDPYVEVSIHVPDWPQPVRDGAGAGAVAAQPPATAARTISYRTGVVKGNGFNPIWEEKLRIPFECVGDMRDLVFVRFVVRHGEREDVEPLAVYCASLGSLGFGYRHLPLHDTQLSQYLFSTLFVRIGVSNL